MKAVIVISLLLLILVGIVSCQSAEQVEFNRYYAAGATVYQAHCQNCHGDNGQGLAALIPPLTDTGYIASHKHQLACYLQNGLQRKINVNHVDFDGKMPAVSLSPIEVAQVLTYVANSFRNKNGLINNDIIENDLKGCE
jgi:mono/diheme cytochrome c family protein